MAEGTRLTHADVERIVQLVEDAGFGYVRFEADGLELELVKEGYEVATAAPAAPSPVPAAAPAAASAPAPVVAAPAAAQPASAAAAPEASPEAPSADEPGVVTSPMVGIFYRAPDPESPPYVEVGQVVEPGATIGLVEVMKMFTAVRTEIGGRVEAILADNAAQVDRGQPLVRVVEA